MSHSFFDKINNLKVNVLNPDSWLQTMKQFCENNNPNRELFYTLIKSYNEDQKDKFSLQLENVRDFYSDFCINNEEEKDWKLDLYYEYMNNDNKTESDYFTLSLLCFILDKNKINYALCDVYKNLFLHLDEEMINYDEYIDKFHILIASIDTVKKLTKHQITLLLTIKNNIKNHNNL
jgi:hypothetical protein